MIFKHKRIFFAENYTISKLYIEDEYLCDIVEDKDRDLNMDGDLDDEGEGKIMKETAIPYGLYEVVLSMSAKFKRILPEILNVKTHTGIRVHQASNGKDETIGTAKNSWGCPIPGENKVKGGVIRTGYWEREIVKLMLEATKRGEKIYWKIIK